MSEDFFLPFVTRSEEKVATGETDFFAKSVLKILKLMESKKSSESRRSSLLRLSNETQA